MMSEQPKTSAPIVNAALLEVRYSEHLLAIFEGRKHRQICTRGDCYECRRLARNFFETQREYNEAIHQVIG